MRISDWIQTCVFRLYMKDADGNGQNVALSKIVRLEDMDGDGVMDKRTIFIDSLLMPRMILPLGDGELLVNETYSTDFYYYTDTDGDGKADERSEERRVGKECVSRFRSGWSTY